jgi:hypothetical protein
VIFKALSDGEYHGAVPENQIEFRASRLRFDRHELHGELTVSCGLAGARVFDEACLNSSSMNFSSSAARKSRGLFLAERARTGTKVDWVGLVEELCTLVLKAEREGEPAVVLSQVETTTAERVIAIDGIPLYPDHHEIDFGDGGTAKSLLALYRAGRLEADGERVMYCDWELTATTHRRRLEQLFGRDRMPSMRYVRCERPLMHEVDRLRRLIVEHEITYAIFDSVGFACDGPPEAAESALNYFRAVRQLRIGGLHLAHVSKAETGDQRPFGSAFWHNSARSTWFMKAADSGANYLTVGLVHRKANLGPLQSARAYTFTFEPDHISVTPVAASTVDALVGDLKMSERIRETLKSGPRTIAAIAKELDAKVDTVEKTVKRGQGKVFTRLPSPDGVARFALLEGRAS